MTPKQPKRKTITLSKYMAEMDKIIFKRDNVADSLIEMIQFTGSVNVVADKEGKDVGASK